MHSLVTVLFVGCTHSLKIPGTNSISHSGRHCSGQPEVNRSAKPVMHPASLAWDLAFQHLGLWSPLWDGAYARPPSIPALENFQDHGSNGPITDQITNTNLPPSVPPPLTNLHISPVIKDQHRYLMRKLRCGGCWHIQLCPDPGHQQRNVYSLLRQSGEPVSEFRCYPGNLLAKHWSPAGWPLLSGSMTSLFLPESKCSEDLWRPGLENSCLLK